MSSDLRVPNQVHASEACHNHGEQSQPDTLTSLIEKISTVALGAFSFYTNWQLFVPFFFIGICIGIYTHITDKESCSPHHPVSSCAHSLLEQLTGVKLPPTISLLANIGVTVCHIDHHDTVFVPIVGVSLGNWIGKTAADSLSLL